MYPTKATLPKIYFMFKKPLGSLIAVAALALSGSAVFQTQVQAQTRPNPSNQGTVFRCVRSGSAYATVAQRGGKTSAPMMIWERYISAEFTPQQRCQTVSQRLTNAVAQNGGSLRNLLLTTGKVNSQTVICYINSGSRCNTSNTLFTLTNPESIRDPGAALGSLLRFGTGASGSSLRETGDDEPTVNMEAAVDEAFAAGGRETVDDENEGGASPNDSPSDEGNTNQNNSNDVPAPETGGSQGGSW